jgi:hypothetical protein
LPAAEKAGEKAGSTVLLSSTDPHANPDSEKAWNATDQAAFLNFDLRARDVKSALTLC